MSLLEDNESNIISVKRKGKSKFKQYNKCSFNGCNKKLSISCIRCKCDKLFCNLHTFYTEHNCTYDFKEEYKQELIKKNKRIKIIKIEKI